MNMHFRALTFGAVALIALVAPVHAENYLSKMGGGGGSHFSDPCPEGQNLTGVEIRGDNEIDAIRPVCVLAYGPDLISRPVLTTGTGLVQVRTSNLFGGIIEEQVAPGWHGGTGGRMVPLLCPSTTPIVLGINIVSEGVDTITVDAIHLFCGRAVASQAAPQLPSAVFDGKVYVKTNMGGKYATRRHHSQRCPSGEVAVGIHGSTGLWVDSIALICAPPRIVPDDGKGVKPAARVIGTPTSGPRPDICESAKAARARNSPAAAGLQKQCDATNAVKPTARVQAGGSAGASAPLPVCEAAAAARDRNSPAAEGLADQCRAIGGRVPDPAREGPTDAELMRKGEALASADSMIGALRAMQPDGPIRGGFDIGLAVTEGQTEWGPGKQKKLDSLRPPEREGFLVAWSFAMDRNRNAARAEVGAEIAKSDAELAEVRFREPDPRFWLGFDIATGIFGDPALGAQGNTSLGPGSEGIRYALSVTARRGFNAAVALHLSRNY